MYADRDKAGRVSLMEISGKEEKYILEALKDELDYYQTAIELLIDVEYVEERMAALGHMIKQMESI